MVLDMFVYVEVRAAVCTFIKQFCNEHVRRDMVIFAFTVLAGRSPYLFIFHNETWASNPVKFPLPRDISYRHLVEISAVNRCVSVVRATIAHRTPTNIFGTLLSTQ